jgi:transposase-like protein
LIPPRRPEPDRQALERQSDDKPTAPECHTCYQRIEDLHRQIRKTIKTRGHFPTEDAARKLIYLSIINAQKNWRPAYNWSAAPLSFKIHLGDRLP